MKEKRYSSTPKTVYLWQELNISLQTIPNFSWFMTGVNVPSPVTSGKLENRVKVITKYRKEQYLMKVQIENFLLSVLETNAFANVLILSQLSFQFYQSSPSPA